MSPLVTAAAIAAVPSTLGAWLSYRATVHGRRNSKTLAVVERQTNGELDRKIERAVRAVFADQPDNVTNAVIAEALRDFLDGVLEAAADER